MRSYFLYILILFFFLVEIPIHAQVSASAGVDSTTMVIGDRFQLYLKVKHPQNTSIESIDISALQDIENLDIEEETAWDTTAQGNGWMLQKNLTLQVWDSGYYWIPEIPIVIAENGTSRVVATNRIPITVNNVALPDSVQLADIKDIIREKANWSDYLPYLLALIVLGLLLGGYYWWKRHKKQKAMPPPPVIKLPAHEIALTALSKLKGEKLWQQGEVKTYQSRLTYIIREYLENRYHVPALESTTDEILSRLKKVDFNVEWKDKLQNILQVADLVKFAKAKPPADFHDQVLKEAEDFVVATRIKSVVNENEENANS